MAIRKNTIKPIAYRFNPSNSVIKICKYMKKCMEDGVMFDSEGIQDEILNSSIVKIGKELGAPILVDSERTAKIMSISHSYRHIYSLEKSPKFSYLKYPYAIYYMKSYPDMSVDKPRPLLIIQKI